jgi:hypothetical protein
VPPETVPTGFCANTASIVASPEPRTVAAIIPSRSGLHFTEHTSNCFSLPGRRSCAVEGFGLFLQTGYCLLTCSLFLTSWDGDRHPTRDRVSSAFISCRDKKAIAHLTLITVAVCISALCLMPTYQDERSQPR